MAETSFGDFKDQIQEIINETVKSHLEDKVYKAENVKGWCEEIIRDILKKLSDKKFQPFKYLANCLVLSKRSNGVHTVTMSLWDPKMMEVLQTNGLTTPCSASPQFGDLSIKST